MKIFNLLFKDFLNIRMYLKNLNSKTFCMFFKEPILMRRIILRLKGKFYVKDKRLYLQLPQGITLNIKNSGMLDVICEIFLSGSYDFDSAGEYIAIDIGMNIGCASLFFSTFKNIKAVYSFEPFTPTYNNALDNFKLNEDISKKIHPYNFGISDKDETIKISYCVNDAAGMTTKVSDLDKIAFSNKKKVHDETVEVKDISYVFKNLLQNNKEKIIFKIDCEGSEYEIFESMDKNNFFENIDIIMLEWHFKGSRILLDILEKRGYISFLRRYNDIAGLIYSIKTNNK